MLCLLKYFCNEKTGELGSYYVWILHFKDIDVKLPLAEQGKYMYNICNMLTTR